MRQRPAPPAEPGDWVALSRPRLVRSPRPPCPRARTPSRSSPRSTGSGRASRRSDPDEREEADPGEAPLALVLVQCVAFRPLTAEPAPDRMRVERRVVDGTASAGRPPRGFGAVRGLPRAGFLLLRPLAATGGDRVPRRTVAIMARWRGSSDPRARWRLRRPRRLGARSRRSLPRRSGSSKGAGRPRARSPPACGCARHGRRARRRPARGGGRQLVARAVHSGSVALTAELQGTAPRLRGAGRRARARGRAGRPGRPAGIRRTAARAGLPIVRLVPVAAGDEVVAALELYRSGLPFGPEEGALARAAAAHVALALRFDRARERGENGRAELSREPAGAARRGARRRRGREGGGRADRARRSRGRRGCRGDALAPRRRWNSVPPRLSTASARRRPTSSRRPRASGAPSQAGSGIRSRRLLAPPHAPARRAAVGRAAALVRRGSSVGARARRLAPFGAAPRSRSGGAGGPRRSSWRSGARRRSSPSSARRSRSSRSPTPSRPPSSASPSSRRAGRSPSTSARRAASQRRPRAASAGRTPSWPSGCSSWRSARIAAAASSSSRTSGATRGWPGSRRSSRGAVSAGRSSSRCSSTTRRSARSGSSRGARARTGTARRGCCSRSRASSPSPCRTRACTSGRRSSPRSSSARSSRSAAPPASCEGSTRSRSRSPRASRSRRRSTRSPQPWWSSSTPTSPSSACRIRAPRRSRRGRSTSPIRAADEVVAALVARPQPLSAPLARRLLRSKRAVLLRPGVARQRMPTGCSSRSCARGRRRRCSRWRRPARCSATLTVVSLDPGAPARGRRDRGGHGRRRAGCARDRQRAPLPAAEGLRRDDAALAPAARAPARPGAGGRARLPVVGARGRGRGPLRLRRRSRTGAWRS